MAAATAPAAGAYSEVDTLHLDTVFTFCDRTIAAIYEPVVLQILPIRYRGGGHCVCPVVRDA